jgi:hypothetical protein
MLQLKNVNAVSIASPPLLLDSPRIIHATSRPVHAVKDLAGFLSLLNSLLGQGGKGSVGPGEPGATKPRHAEVTPVAEQQKRKQANIQKAETKPQQVWAPLAQAIPAGLPVAFLQVGEKQLSLSRIALVVPSGGQRYHADIASQQIPDAPQDFSSAAALSTPQAEPNASPGITFALRLTQALPAHSFRAAPASDPAPFYTVVAKLESLPAPTESVHETIPAARSTEVSASAKGSDVPLCDPTPMPPAPCPGPFDRVPDLGAVSSGPALLRSRHNAQQVSTPNLPDMDFTAQRHLIGIQSREQPHQAVRKADPSPRPEETSVTPRPSAVALNRQVLNPTSFSIAGATAEVFRSTRSSAGDKAMEKSTAPRPVALSVSLEAQRDLPAAESRIPAGASKAQDVRSTRQGRTSQSAMASHLPNSSVGTISSPDSRQRVDREAVNSREAANSKPARSRPVDNPVTTSQDRHEHDISRQSNLPAGQPPQVSGVSRVGTEGSDAKPAHGMGVSPEVEARSAVRPQPIREISLKLSGAATKDINVQVIEKAGKVQVAVRAPDQETAKSLQTNLGDLVGRLEGKGYRTEVWIPAATQHGDAAVKGAHSAHRHGQAGDSGAGAGQQPGHDQQESSRRQQARWRAQLKRTFSATMARTENTRSEAR